MNSQYGERVKNWMQKHGLKVALSKRVQHDPKEAAANGTNGDGSPVAMTTNLFDLNSSDIDRAALFVLITSQKSISDDTCGEELHAAYETSKNIIAVWAEEPQTIQQAPASAGSVGMMLQQAPTIKLPGCQFPAGSTTISTTDVSTKGPHMLLACVFEKLAAATDGAAQAPKAGPSRQLIPRIPPLARIRSSKVKPAPP